MNALDEADVLARATAAAGAPVRDLRRLPGGVSSLTFAATMAGAPIVVKVAPPGLPPVRHRDVLRQARVLSALRDTAVPVPEVYFCDPGEPPLFGMQFAAGQCWEPATDLIADPPDAGIVAERARAAARTLALLHRVNTSGIDETQVPLAAELDRWRDLLATVEDDIAPGHHDIYRRLAATLPAPVEPRLLHGDFRLGNLVFDRADLSAVIDWEIWSIGDPRTDVAWLLLHADPAHRFFTTRDARCAAAAAGLPSAGELQADYVAAGGRDVDDLDWFLAYCQYKIAATVSVFVKRNRRAREPDPGITAIGATLPAVLDRADLHLDPDGGRR